MNSCPIREVATHEEFTEALLDLQFIDCDFTGLELRMLRNMGIALDADTTWADIYWPDKPFEPVRTKLAEAISTILGEVP